MDPNRIEELINAAVDGQIGAEDEAALAESAAGGIEAQTLAAAVREQDAQLRAAFKDRREAAASVAERAMQSIASLNPPLHDSETATTDSNAGDDRRHALSRSERRHWLSLLLAAAAGFLLAVILFRPWERESQDVGGPRIVVQPAVAHLAVATGPVQVMPANQLAILRCPISGPIESGAKVSTGPQVRCEFSTPDGSAVRLDGDTAVKFDRPRAITMEQGELWSNVARAQEPFAVKASQATVTADEGKFDLSCKSGATVLKVVEGSAQVSGAHGEQTVPAGHQVRIDRGAVTEVEPIQDLLTTTQWLNSLLVLQGPDNPELDERMKLLFAQIGRSKLEYLYEDEIRAMGDASALPLVHYLNQSAPESDQSRRVEAARILADLAPPRVIPELISLLSDQNGEVRFHVAKALARLTGQTQGRTADAWRADSWNSCQATRRDWQTWWEENKKRYVADEPPPPPVLKSRGDNSPERRIQR